MNTQQLKQQLQQRYDYIGETRQREMARLVFEIAKREKLGVSVVVEDLPQPPERFDVIKTYLINRRFPQSLARGVKIRESFAEVAIDPQHRVDLKKPLNVTPKAFFIEKAVAQSELAQRVQKLYPDVPVTLIDSYREFNHKTKEQMDVYNRRDERFFLIEEKFDFYKSCPCSSDSVHCGYHIVNLGQGCLFECTYCYLQEFLQKPGIMIPANLEDFFTKYTQYEQDVRIGSGEATDSLIFDHITGYGARIVDFFRQYPKTQFEFKTKSDNIDGLLSVKGASNVVISWSVNPSNIISAMEYYTATLDQRLAAAKKCVDHGYSVAFHFDPIIHHEGWQVNYQGVVDQIFDTIPEQAIAWISLGTLRMLPSLKKVIENRFPKNPILNGEMLTGYDGKLRYAQPIRNDIYQHMTQCVRNRSTDTKFYLCMEDKEMCGSVQS